MSHLLTQFGAKSPTTSIRLITGACLIIAVLSLANINQLFDEKKVYSTAIDQVYLPLAEILSAYPHEDNPPTLALSDAGAIPYYSEWQVIDINGYNDPVIATSGDIQTQYILSQEPDVIILVSNRGDQFIHDNERYGLYYEEFSRAGLDLLGVIQVVDDYFFWLMVDPESEVFTYLWNALRP